MAKAALSRSMKLYGTDEPIARQRVLTAGNITAVFDNGGLRYVRYRGVEVLRGISFLVRDKNWGTYGAAISRLKVKQSKTGFAVSYHAECKDATQEIHYEAKIVADSGSVKFSAVGLPITDVLTNRTGFVVLHPLNGVVGEAVEIAHTDGKKRKSTFPKIISPGQPVFEIRSLKHAVMPGVTATVLMEGNKFEMEDHRNWMDASYKTYVCSLLDPWPYTLPKGKSFEQSITLTLDGKPKQSKKSAKRESIFVSVGGAQGRLPLLSVSVPMAEAKATLEQAKHIVSLKLQQLVCQIDGRNSDQAEAARNFAELARRLNLPVKLEIVLPAKESADREMARIASAVRVGGLKPQSVVVTQMHDLKSFQPNTPRPWGPTYEEMAKAARSEFPEAVIGGGMLSYFTELNRKPVPNGLFDFVTHTVCPIVHAADDVSVMETLESLPWIFASARKMIGKTPYHIGPSSIPCRDNPYGAAVAANPDNRRVCLSDNDPRQRGLFAAAWNLGLVAAAARGGVASLTLGSFTGSQGIFLDDGPVPAYHVLAGLAGASRARRLHAVSSAPSIVETMAYETSSSRSLWLTNLTADNQTVKLSGFNGAVELHVIEAGNFTKLRNNPSFMTQPGSRLKKAGKVTLSPYSIVRLCAEK